MWEIQFWRGRDRGRIDEAGERRGEARQNARDRGKAVRKPCQFWNDKHHYTNGTTTTTLISFISRRSKYSLHAAKRSERNINKRVNEWFDDRIVNYLILLWGTDVSSQGKAEDPKPRRGRGHKIETKTRPRQWPQGWGNIEAKRRDEARAACCLKARLLPRDMHHWHW